MALNAYLAQSYELTPIRMCTSKDAGLKLKQSPSLMPDKDTQGFVQSAASTTPSFKTWPKEGV